MSVSHLHHVSALTGDVNHNKYFYQEILGLKLVKQTVNFDDRQVWHIYYGGDEGQIGSLISFYVYPGLQKGRDGKGLVCTTAFSVPMAGIDYWMERMDRFDVAYKSPQVRFGSEVFMYLEDFEGLGIELVFTERDERASIRTGSVDPTFAIKGLYNVELWVNEYLRTGAFLERHLGMMPLEHRGNRMRYGHQDEAGYYIDLMVLPEAPNGLKGAGKVNHFALSTPNIQTLETIRTQLKDNMVQVSEPMNRKYYRSIYFKEPNGVQMEVSTALPGMLVDESAELLGTGFMLPTWLEGERTQIVDDLTDNYGSGESFRTDS